jgi:hypothetical protein
MAVVITHPILYAGKAWNVGDVVTSHEMADKLIRFGKAKAEASEPPAAAAEPPADDEQPAPTPARKARSVKE